VLYNYIALLIFSAFAVFVPLSFVLTAKLLGRKPESNPIKNAPYESAEETVGSSKDIDNEYLPYFMIFLPFEIVLVVLISWSTVTKSLNFTSNIAIIMLGVVSTILSFVGYKMARG
jgi:NADH:ubiquinone oxidoreductase subunit 3 (subunit A)